MFLYQSKQQNILEFYIFFVLSQGMTQRSRGRGSSHAKPHQSTFHPFDALNACSGRARFDAGGDELLLIRAPLRSNSLFPTPRMSRNSSLPLMRTQRQPLTLVEYLPRRVTFTR
jgi:hypothetical protein